MRKIVWSNEAIIQLRDADRYYRRLDPQAADRLSDRVLAAAALLAGNPFVGLEVEGSIGKWSVRRTDHAILYRVGRDALRILYVVHAAQDWQRFL